MGKQEVDSVMAGKRVRITMGSPNAKPDIVKMMQDSPRPQGWTHWGKEGTVMASFLDEDRALKVAVALDETGDVVEFYASNIRFLMR